MSSFLERFSQSIEHTAENTTKELRPQILEALDSFKAEGLVDVSPFHIEKKVSQLHPQKHRWNVTRKILLAIYQLEQHGEIGHTVVPATQEEIERNAPRVKYFYHRVEQPQN